MREAPSVVIIAALEDAGARIRVYDPQGMEHARNIFSGVEYATDAYECIAGADAMVILTEWEEFRGLDLVRVKTLLKRPIVVDLRNVYQLEEMAQAGFTYVSVGRRKVEGATNGASPIKTANGKRCCARPLTVQADS
jgi:UDPglucose 6-dehydrogenase